MKAVICPLCKGGGMFAERAYYFMPIEEDTMIPLACICGGFCALLIPLAGLYGYKGARWAIRKMSIIGDNHRIKSFDSYEELMKDLEE